MSSYNFFFAFLHSKVKRRIYFASKKNNISTTYVVRVWHNNGYHFQTVIIRKRKHAGDEASNGFKVK